MYFSSPFFVFFNSQNCPWLEIPSDRDSRESTKEASAAAKGLPGPSKQAGHKKGGCETKKSKQAKQLLPTLFDIGLPECEQPAGKLEFLRDQKTERKCVLPPVIGMLGVERRRRDREAAQEKRAKREQEEAADRFAIVGNK